MLLFSKGLLLCLSLVLGVLSAQPARTAPHEGNMYSLSREEAQLFEEARKYYDAKEFSRLAALLKMQVDDKNRPHPYVCTLYGLACMQLKDYSQAIAAFRKALAATPDNADLQQNLAIALMAAHQYAEAARLFNVLLATVAQDKRTEIRYSAAQCAYFAHDYRQAMQLITPLAEQGKARAEWVHLAAISALQQKAWQVSEQYFERLVNIAPEKKAYWKGLAHVRSRMNRNDAALAALEVASRLPDATLQDKQELADMYQSASAPLLSLETLKLMPQRTGADIKRLEMLERAGRYGQALAEIDKQLPKEGRIALYWLKGRILYRQYKLDEARNAFLLGAAIQGREAERCRMMAGMIAWEQGLRQEARDAFQILAKGGLFVRQAKQGIATLDSLETSELELLSLSPEGTPPEKE